MGQRRLGLILYSAQSHQLAADAALESAALPATVVLVVVADGPVPAGMPPAVLAIHQSYLLLKAAPAAQDTVAEHLTAALVAAAVRLLLH